MIVGTCKLCQRSGQKLQKSHFLPAGVYRILRDPTASNPHPWTLTKTRSFQSCNQMKAALLCHDCEQRLNRGGENWVLRHCLKNDGSFPLRSILLATTPVASSPDTNIYRASNIGEINIAAISYFAASIYWRGSIHPWNEDRSRPVDLGPFEESFRRFLMGMEDFPTDCALLVVVRNGKSIDRLTAVPFGGRLGHFHVYNFPMPGFAFSLTVTKNLQSLYRRLCFLRGHGNPIILSSNVEKSLFNMARNMRQSSASSELNE